MLSLIVGVAYGCVAQGGLNSRADAIVGVYESVQEGYRFRATISKQADGTYKAQMHWMEHDRDVQGNKLLDTKNPKRELRSTPCDRVVLIEGMTYDSKKQRWGNAKIYDPLRGIRANVNCWFVSENELRLKGTLVGISETVTWRKIASKQ